MTLADGALTVGEGGAPLTLPTDEPTSKPIVFTNWDMKLLDLSSTPEPPMTPADLGRLRVAVLHSLAALPANDTEPSEDKREGVFQLAAESVRTVAALAQTREKPTMLWNEEMEADTFLGRTLLLADHLIVPDHVFDTLLRRGNSRSLREAAEKMLRHADLISAGIVIPVARGVSMAVSGSSAVELTDRDLTDPALVGWVRDQLILEGPTAREALFVRAIDDWSKSTEKFWLHGHIDPDSMNADDGSFATRLLQQYDPSYDYGPWIKQVSDSAVGYYVQRTNERVVTADVFGSEYVAASMFEARLLRRRRASGQLSAAQASIWADVPRLPELEGRDLVKVLQNEEAVEALRRQVRSSLVTARTPGDQVDAITSLAHELETASHRLERAARTDRVWQAIAPAGLGTASVVVGAFSGGLPAVLGGAASVIAGMAPFLGARINTRREAAYLFVVARRTQR